MAKVWKRWTGGAIHGERIPILQDTKLGGACHPVRRDRTCQASPRPREYSVLHTLSEAGRLTHEASNNTLHARMDSGISAHEALVHGTLSSPALI